MMSFRKVPERQNGCVVGVLANLEARKGLIQSRYDFARRQVVASIQCGTQTKMPVPFAVRSHGVRNTIGVDDEGASGRQRERGVPPRDPLERTEHGPEIADLFGAG